VADRAGFRPVWKRHRRFSGDGTWDRIHTALLAHADAVGEIDWSVSVDSTINRAHQHGTNLTRATPAVGSIGGTVESQESERRAG
jgi:transposase